MKKRAICLLAALLAVMQVLCACNTKEEPKQQISQEPSQSVEGTAPIEDPTAPSQNNDNSEAQMTKRLAGATAVIKQGDLEASMELNLKYDEKGIIRSEKNFVYPDGTEQEASLFDSSLLRPLGDVYNDEDGNEIRLTSYVYDVDGNLIQETSDQGMQSYQYTYDSEGRLAASTCKYYYNGEEIVYTTYSYEFNQEGKVIHSEEASDDGTGRTTDYKYDENGHLIEELFVIVGVTEGKYTYEYDENGNLIKENGEEGLIEYRYDESDRVIEMKTDFMTTEYHYDDNGRLISRKEYYGDEEDMVEYHYEYDAEGDLVSIVAEEDFVTISVTFQYEMVDNFVFENETLSDYVQYAQDELYELF